MAAHNQIMKNFRTDLCCVSAEVANAFDFDQSKSKSGIEGQ